jgi:pyrroline-5-carboxylate reductase
MTTATRGRRIGFIGGGNMAEALVRGLSGAGHEPASIIVAEPVAARRTALSRRYRVKATAGNAEAVAGAGAVILAVKPQVIDDVLAGLANHVTAGQVVISIAAGVTLKRLETALGAAARVVRVMPNTPCLVGRGVSVLCGGARARPADLKLARGLFATVGKVHVTDDEKAMDAVTGLSGSGPAYVYLFAEALIRGGVKAGLDPELASELAYETIAGAAEMLIQTGQTPEALRKAVTSPGGTTLAGLQRLDEGKLTATVAAGVVAATRRSRELGRGKP